MRAVIDYINELEEELISIRRDIHKHPELGFKEERTAQRVEERLTSLGLKTERKKGTGVIGLLDCGEGPTIALRADMDALPIPEQTKLSYKSINEGVMHACGHDGHTAVLLITAKILKKFRYKLKGKVKFIFQPAEEGPGGARPLIKAGVLSSPDVDSIFGLHINNQLPTGVIGIHPNIVSAAADEVDIVVKGKSGHASTPHQGVDAVAAAGQVVTALQTLVSREISPQAQVVINLGTIEGGYRRNVIADEVKIKGTVRTTDSQIRKEMPVKFDRIIKGATSSYGADYQLDYNFGYPVLKNDSDLVEELIPTIKEIPWVKGIEYLSQPSLGAEDFAYYLKEIPGVFFRLGAAKTGEDYYSAHHPKFTFDEGTLKVGVILFTWIVMGRLQDI